ncbi:MAG TPA: tRNA isopentenyl-2-thiomethyl-A-37 hydroxylase MiaE [Kofleriaceae bacterium]|jgi:tRNA-(ms[2]io[6]A)-hydroxylase|nr:tRNA isopentenyl-2-thiomethyl-A-37 hydroxylase MiaE [Kofleriaceae bacterium]
MDNVPDLVPDLRDALPLVGSDPAWLTVALGDLDSVHADHLHCERKAAQSALSLIRSYPERGDLVTAMARLAHDETRHVVQVAQLLARRGQPASYDHGDDYAAALRAQIRAREPDRLLDRLLVFATIEGRSAERLGLLAGALEDPKARELYASLAAAEVRHRDTFLGLARDAAPLAFGARAAELCVREAEILANRPVTARIH